MSLSLLGLRRAAAEGGVAQRPALRGLIRCGVLAPVLFTAAWIAGGVVQDGYSPRREDISALAAVDAEHAWIVVCGLALTGVLTAAFAIGLRCALPGSTVGAALVALAGVGLVGLGLLRNDCSSLTEACRARVDAGAVSWHHRAHDIVSAPVFAAAVAAPLVLARPFRRDARLKALAPYSLATAAVLSLLFALGGVEALPAWDGALQRAAVSLALVWMEVVALRLLRGLGWPPARTRRTMILHRRGV